MLCALPGLAHKGSWDPEERGTVAVKLAMVGTEEGFPEFYSQSMEQPFLHMGLADPNVNSATMARFCQARPGGHSKCVPRCTVHYDFDPPLY